ncbi:MAG: FKBP-type peptidyl-prolyl cis-trans isomerase [Pseudomonadota bacterium]|nr:FKBP-type peptidyl-prolyl cis-trans isomerase [Pseudomonadota bacterium]
MNNSLYAAAPITQEYTVIREVERGQGRVVQDGDTITVNYVAYQTAKSGGYIIDERKGSDSFTFKLGSGEVEESFSHAILGGDTSQPMREGGKRRFVIPENLSSFGTDVHFDVHLVKIHD